MTVPQLMPWIGGPVSVEAALSPLICPIDDTVASQIIESDAKVVDAAVKHAHAAFLEHQDATTAKRVEWLLAAAEAIDKIEGELVRSLIRFIGKPRRAATFEAKRVGAFIRKARLDEFPQILNVLKGDMSFVGPRPERPVFVGELSKAIPYYCERHRIKPGITGWAQIRYPYGASVDDAKEKLKFDLYYMKNQSIFLDVLILLKTLRVVFWSEGAR